MRKIKEVLRLKHEHGIQSGPWLNSMESITIAMRDDLQKLSKH
jgi:hypothetical protein